METLIKFYAKDSQKINEIETAIIAIEQATKENLNFSITKYGKPFQLSCRTEFLAPMLNKIPDDRGIPLITNAKKEKMILFSGLFLTKGYNYASTPMWYLVLDINKQMGGKSLQGLFRSLATILDNFWGTTSLGETEGRFARQGFTSYTPSSNEDLPKLPPPKKYDTPYIPGNLGWLNYWPAPALKRIGFKQQHRALFHNVQDAANGGLILQITKEPLDFEMEGHLSKTVAIYDALPAIGGRDCV